MLRDVWKTASAIYAIDGLDTILLLLPNVLT